MVTLDDIAIATGFDRSTVSVTLRNAPRAKRFSAKTRAAILEAAERMGYRPNLFAQQLADRKPRLLMLCVNSLRDPFAMMVAEGFEARAAESGLRVLITTLKERQDPLDLHRDILGVQGVPAIALVGGSAAKLPDASLRKLADGGVKIMLVNRNVVHPGIGHVRCDEAEGGRLIAEHVYADPRVRDVWIVGGMEGPAFDERLAAMRQVAAARGAAEPTFVRCGPVSANWSDDAAEHVHAALRAPGARRPHAVMALSDVLALGAARALARDGLTVGRDVIVTGYDDGVYARAFWPPLTTVRLPMDDMGRNAADGLIRLLSETDTGATDVVLPVTLMIRESSRLADDAR